MPFFKFKSLFFFFILLLASACGNGSKTSGSGSFVSPSPSLTPSCGDSVCDAVHGETPATCPADCSTLGAGAVTPGSGPGGGGTGPGGTGPGGPSPSATCGNGICEMGESFAACASDCADRLTAGFEVASLVPAHLQMDPATTSSNIHLVVRRFGGDVSVLNFGLSNTSPSEGGITVSAGTIGSSNELDFTITVGASVPPGDYHLTLKVDGPTGARYVDFLLKVNPPTGSGTPPGGGSVCGDRTCTPPETAATCPADCGFDPSRPPVCGDGFCHPAETSSGCPADCPVGPTCDNDGLCEVGETPATCDHDCTPGGSVCGNSRCESGETTALCPADCPVAPGGGMGSTSGTFEALPAIPMRIESSMYADYPLQIRRIDGFAGDVSVSVENVTPTRDAASILPASPVILNPSSNIPIRIGVNPYIAPGSRLELTLALSSSGITRRVTIPIEVTQGFVVDSMDPISATIAAGGTRTVEFAVNRRGETEAITMELDENPPESPFTVATRTIPSGATSGEMRINVNPSARPGDYRLTFYLHTSRTSRFLNFPITVTAPAPSTRGLELVSLTPGGSRITAGTSLTEHIVVNRNSEPTTNPILVRGRDVSPIPSAGSIGLSGRIEPGSSEADLAVTVSPEVPTGNYILLLEISSPATMIPYPLAIQVVRPDSGMAPGGGTPPMGFIPPDIPYPDLPPRACINDTENIWVDDDRGDDATHEGTRARPLKSVIYARELAARASPQKNVCVFEGNYSGRSGPCSGGVCTNYTLTVDVNIYGGFAWNGSSVTRANIRDPLARRTVLTNDGGRPVVSFYSSSESKTLEGFRIIAGPQYSSGALVSIQGPALLKNNTIAIGDMAPRSPRPSESSRFMRVGVSVSTTAGNSIRNAVIESNQISVGRIYPSQGAAVGVLVENNTARGDASIVDFTVKKNQIEVGSAPVASVGILATSNRMEPVNSYRIEDNTIIYGAGLQTSDSSLLPCPSVDGSDTVTCITSESGYLGAVPGESGGIILGKKLNTGLTEPIFEETRFTSAQILRNNIHPKLRYFGIALSGNASYGIALQNGDMYTASVVGSNIVQANRARKTSSALYLHKAMVKIYNNTLRAGLASGGNLVSCSSETIPVPGGVDEVSQNCVLDSVSSAVFVDDRIPGGTESPYFSNLDLVNNIFSGERGDATHTPVAGIFEVYNRPSSIRERSNFNSIVLLRNNFFDTSLSNPFVFYRIGEIEAWQIPFSEIVSLGTRIRYASAGGQPARSINNTRGDPGLVNPSQFEFHLLPDSPIGAGGDCSADILRLNPKEIDGTNFPSIGCAIGADQFVSP